MILVTGATGFIGGAAAHRLSAEGMKVRAASRRAAPSGLARLEPVLVADAGLDADWGPALAGVDAVVHCAARVHVLKDPSTDPLAEYRRVNVEGTLNLARQAARAGVRRFVFISSIKVNGEETAVGRPYSADDAPAPVDPYGVSKHEAELALRGVARDTGMELVTIRPVLVYGPGVKGNFLSLLRWLHRGLPLPFGALHNRRSLVALENVVDLVSLSLHHPRAANQTFLVSDGEDLSTTELLRRTAAAMHRQARLIPMPVWLLRAGAGAVGRGDLARRLCGSLQVDIRKTRELLDWTPPVSVDDALKRTARHFLENSPHAR